MMSQLDGLRFGAVRSILAGTFLAGLFAAQADASVLTYSHIKIDNLQFFVDNGGGDVGPAITDGVHVNVVTMASHSGSVANIASIPFTTTSSAIGGGSSGLNSFQAYEGAGSAPFENSFGIFDPPLNVPHARGDSKGSGFPVSGTAEPFGLSAELVTEVHLSNNPTVSNLGSADSASTSVGSFTIVPLAPLNVVAFFSATRSLLTDLTPVPPANFASADMSVSLTIDDAATGRIFEFTPDGGAGGIFGGTEYADPFTLNGGASAFPGSGNTASNGPSLFGAGVTLLPGHAYSISLNLQSAASAGTLGVPEPASLLLALGLLTMHSVNLRRREA